eukprot:700160_1
MHRYAEASLNEEQIEDYIMNSLKPQKWKSQDRIRYFAYKKNRIITLIEMPRSKPNQADLMNAYERRHQSRHTNPNTKDDQTFERRRQRRASRPSITDKATNSHTKHYSEHLELRALRCDCLDPLCVWQVCMGSQLYLVKEIAFISSQTPIVSHSIDIQIIINSQSFGFNCNNRFAVFGSVYAPFC